MKHKTITNLTLAITTHLLIASLLILPPIEKTIQPRGHRQPTITVVSE